MHAAIDTWLARFAAGAGSQYTWHLVGVINEHGRIESMLRAMLPTGEMCPLTAQATYEEGTIYQVEQWRMVGASQGLEAYWWRRIIAIAADDDDAADPDVRARLLRICGMGAVSAPCPRCRGTGTLRALNPEGGTSVEWQCPECHGSGSLACTTNAPLIRVARTP